MKMNEELKWIAAISGISKDRDKQRSKLTRVANQLEAIIGDITKSLEVKYTGWYVLLRRKEKGWECVGVVNPEIDSAISDEFDLSLPIPDPETITEFQGW